jgi:chromosome segregation ATPase
MKDSQTPPARNYSRSSSKSQFNQRISISTPANPPQAPPPLAAGGFPSNQHIIDDLTVKLRQATIMKDHLDASVKGMREKVMQMEQKYLKADNINELRLQRLKDELAGMKEAQANIKMQLKEEEKKTTQNQLKMQNLANAKARAERLAVDARQEADELREQLVNIREEFALLNRKKAEK